MADTKYRVHFDDRTHEDVLAADAVTAKNKARNKRIQALDPAGNMLKADVMGHASVKIAKIEDEDDRARADSQRSSGGPAGSMQSTLTTILAILGTLATYGALHYLDALGSARLGVASHAGVLDLMAFSGTAMGATLTALAAVTGDSALVPSFSNGKRGWLLQTWCDFQVAGTFRIRSGKMHDNVSGIRYDAIISDLYPLFPWGAKQELYQGDTVNVDGAGSAVAGDIEYVLLLRYFEELSAQHANLLNWEDVLAKTVNIHAVENTIATGATAAWAGAEAINAEIDQFHARGRYALMGYVVDVEVPAIAWRGIDTANARVGGPGIETDREVTQDWFLHLSRAYKTPLVPCFMADNRAATTIDSLQDENGADTTVISIYAELAA